MAEESEDEDLLGDGRLLKRLLSRGVGPRPKLGSRVAVHYESFVALTGMKFDSSIDRVEPFDFILGEGDVVEAWDIGVATMQPGERSAFRVMDPALAFGEASAADGVEPGAALRFTIELLTGRTTASSSSAAIAAATSGAVGEHRASAAVAEEAAPTAALVGDLRTGGAGAAGGAGAGHSDERRLAQAKVAKDKGNEQLRIGDLSGAQEVYDEALAALRGLQGTELELLKAASALRLSCLLNSALCALRQEDFAKASQQATEALKIDPQSCKALYRRGLARMSCGSLRESREDLLEASRLDPKNGEIRSKMQECKEKMVQSEEQSRSAFGGIFGKAPEQQVVSRNLANLPKVWMDIQIGAAQPQRLRFALYTDSVPRTAENFRALCTGERGVGSCGQPLHYRQTLVHRIAPRSLVEAGDLESYDGSGGESIYGRAFEDEGFADAHHKRGLLSMANRGPNTNNSKFFVTLRSLPQFDGKHVVFGEVIGDSVILEQMEALETKYPDKPVTQVAIVDCGQS